MILTAKLQNYMKKLQREKLATRHYNYHMMKEIMGKDIKTHTPRNGYSWGLKFINNRFDYGYIQQDHLMVSKNISEVHVEYDWSFVDENKENYLHRDIQKGYPDHAILRTKVWL